MYRSCRLISLILIGGCNFVFAQQKKTVATADQSIPRPKLVVGLVIDQMRWDYLYRYYDRFGKNGFRRIMNGGFNCENTFMNFLPTYTAAGHCGIYTGSVPAINGIIGNTWYDRKTGKQVYCSDDSTVTAVGSLSAAGKMSPVNMWANTITDELRLSNNFQSKVIGVALKDRGGIFPAGHSANAAYWFDDGAGKWISSSYYMKELPAWVNTFNEVQVPSTYFQPEWNTLFPIATYTASTADEKKYEGTIAGEKQTIFPHTFKVKEGEDKYLPFRHSPFGNTITFDFAKAAVENEKLGRGEVTDFLAISLSSTDYIGHIFGPNSIETEDTYLRIDKDISSFLQFLDEKVGKGNYTLFLTADHGAAHIPGFLEEHHLPGGTFSISKLVKDLNSEMETRWGLKKTILRFDNYQLYLNLPEIGPSAQRIDSVKTSVKEWLMQQPYVSQVFETGNIQASGLPEPIREMAINGYNAQRGGDLQVLVKPNYFEGGKTGTTHGVWNPYDSHIPLLWYGWGIKNGKLYRNTYMTDIAATLAALLKIQMPNGCIGKVIPELLQEK